MADDITTDVGDGAKNINAGKGNKQDITENNADNNVTINIPMPAWPNVPIAPEHKPHSETAKRRDIPVELERELRQNLSALNDTLVKLSGTVEVNNELTKININLLKEQVGQAKTLAEKTQEMVAKGLSGINVVIPAKPPPPWVWPMFTSFGVLFAILLSLVVFYLATGGH